MTHASEKDVHSPLRRFLSRFARNKNPSGGGEPIRIDAGFRSWDDAKKNVAGYESECFFERVRNAAEAVADGKAVYERESVVFDKIQYSWPLLASLLFAAANLRRLRLIDFGGLGTSFRQNRKFLTALEIPCEWRIVEQRQLVEIGRREFTSKYITFYNSIGEALKDGVDAVLFSGVLGYLENPYRILSEAIESGAPCIILDRTRVTLEANDIFAVQHVPPSIYEASFPLRAFNYNNLLSPLREHYEVVEEWASEVQPGLQTTGMGFLLRRRQGPA
ncbi:MAG: methyltransferase, TIGR04325 family [Methylocapsa sp.]|nr:methyltransferase, TIGR04325 family [Methylocapsa sp.]